MSQSRTRMPNRSRAGHRRLLLLPIAGLALLGSGCDWDSVVSIPPFGTLVVTTATSGSNPDPDGYELSASGPSLDVDRGIGTNESVMFSIVTAGDYRVGLSGIAANCSVDVSPQVVRVALGNTSAVTFNVSCS